MLKTGHRTKYHLRAFEFLAARRRSRAVLTCTLFASFLATMPTAGLQAGDILRGGASAGNAKRNSDARANAGAAAAEAAKVKAQDRLARTTKAVNDMRALQASARAAAGANSIPNGLTEGGLKVLTGANAKWEGANPAAQSGNTVGITQTAAQALLHWETFNVGSQTTVNFDQSAGGVDSGKWIAFNKVFDPTAKPSEIRGKINAQGQVYIINQNGIIFGAGSQVNARTLVASSLPINDNLTKNGLLNNKDAQFLFSGLDVPGGSDGTPAFIPTPLPVGAKYGDVAVERGALLQTPTSADGNGGRVMLVGANVRNEGQISTPAGQTILAAGLQVGIQSHKSDDPSLRGLDVWVGSVGDYAGEIKNSGLIESKAGSILLTGKQINHSGILESSTTVSLNGRIDLFASYGAVGNPGFDNSTSQGAGFAPFIPQFTGIVSMAPSSVIRILPSTDTSKKVPGTRLPEVSQINFLGKAVYFGAGSMTLAPNAKASIRAGVWSYSDTNGDRIANDPFLKENLQRSDSGRLADDPIWGYTSSLLYSEGQVYFDSSSLFDVSGTVGAFVPFTDYIVDIQFRGNELADSPLQRTSKVRGKNLTVDLRKSGTYGGAGWVGSPLGDLNGIAGTIARDASQLTTAGGEISVNAGNAIVIASGAILDVSGGSFQYEGGKVATSRLIRNGVIVPIHQATPDKNYDSILGDSSTQISTKWGVSKTFQQSLSPNGGYVEPSYVGGASAGTIRLTAPGLLLAGELIGQSINGPRQKDNVAGRSLLKLSFVGEKKYDTGGVPTFIYSSPNPPTITATTRPSAPSVPVFEIVAESAKPIPENYLTSFMLPSSLYDEDEGGFGSIQIRNEGGDFVVNSDSRFEMRPGSGLKASARNVNIAGNIIAPGGTVSLTAYNYSPYIYSQKALLGEFTDLPPPSPLSGTGLVSIFSGGGISVAGGIVDDRPTSSQTYSAGKNIHGGTILLEGYGINFEKGSTLDASGGAYLSFNGKKTNGNGGKIQLFAGVDPGLSTSIGGKLELGGTLKGYGFGKGGTLALKSAFVQIGGGNAPADTLLLNPSFFQSGGFSNFEINAIGGRTDSGAMRPAIKLVAGTTLEPRAESLLLNPFGGKNGAPATNVELQQEGVRPATSITLKARGLDDIFIDPLTGAKLEALGLIVLEKGSKISTDAGASVVIDGDAIYSNGSILAPGGKISITGRSKFLMTSTLANDATYALPTVYIGSSAQISAAGTSIALPDPYGRRTGILYPGGTISIAGNILAESGAVLNVSGASADFDLHPNRAGLAQNGNPDKKSGVTSGLWQLLSQPVQVDSDGGTIRLAGSEFVYSSATLQGRAGGPSALGGTLIVSSNRFYGKDDFRKGSDINMVTRQTGDSLAFGGFSDSTALLNNLFLSGSNFESSIGNAFAISKSNPGIGFFAVEQFVKGGFDSLDLNFYLNRGAPTLGGNIDFQGPVSIKASGFLRLAGGGLIKADSTVSLQAAFVAVGQEFRPPLNPADTTENAIFYAFEEEAAGVSNRQLLVAPEPGAGSLNIQASLIDLGTLTLKGISRANLSAPSGDVRGSGTVSIAGDISITAAQVYPTTLATFEIFAYAGGDSLGRVNISASGTNALPLSAGGSLRIFAHTIQQSGVLSAPFGSITLGWDGLDTDPSDSDLDAPVNSSVGSLLSTPIASSINLAAGSTTSVSSIDPETGEGIVVPFGLSPDGLSWIDPRGVNVTTSGLPTRRIQISGDSITSESGSVIDLRGGGDLLAYRWLPGIGGTSDILGLGATVWQAKNSYNAGDLVVHNGSTWSARVSIAPEKIFDDTTPSAGRYWKLVPESFAVIPGFGSNFAPYNAFNTGDNASGLAGAQGFVSNSLRIGQKISLAKGSALAEGTYTLLPRRYGVLPGAYLVLPTDGNLRDSSSSLDLATLGYRSPGLGGETIQETGSSFVSGYTFNSLHGGNRGTPVSRTFEILTPELLAERASYETYSANSFILAAAARLSLTTRQTLPIDSGHLSLLGKSGLSLSGTVYGKNNFGGYGALIDVASLANIVLQGAGSPSAPSGSVALSVATLNAWGAESLLIGGTRKANSDGSATLTARTPSLTLDNSQTPLSAPDVSLVSLETVKLLAGSRVQTSGTPSTPSSSFTIWGDGALVRASGNTQASFSRTGVTGAAGALLEIGAGAAISGGSVVLDSSYASDINPNVSLDADFLSLRSGQISIVYGTPPLTGAEFNPHLVLAGSLLEKAANSRQLELQSYRTIDLYGEGIFGGSSLASLSLKSSGLRGFAQGVGGFKITAGELTLSNPESAIVLPDSANSGTLNLEASKILLGANAFSVSGYNNLNLIAPSGVLATKTGSLRTTGGLSVTTSLLATTSSSSYSISASNQFDLLPSTVTPAIEKGLGGALYLEGQSIAMGSSINLPSGLLTLRAKGGDLNITGSINTENISKQFQDVTKSTNAGEVRLVSDTGNINLSGSVSVSATSGDGAAGLLSVSAPGGAFSSSGTFQGRVALASSASGGSFALDVGSLTSFPMLRDKLTEGGFTESWNLRRRTGAWELTGVSKAAELVFSADAESIIVDGILDASGTTGGNIGLYSRGSVIVKGDSKLTVKADKFNNAGKGGTIRLEAGAVDSSASANLAGFVTLETGSEIDLGVTEFRSGDYADPISSAFYGKFQGKLQIRAPRNGLDLNVNPLLGTITDASAVTVEAFRVYTPTSGTLNTTVRNGMHTDNLAYLTADNESLLRSNLLNGILDTTDAANLDKTLVIMPGVELVNPTGSLTLGSAGTTSGTPSSEAWDLATYRYGSKASPGILTLRAKGDIVVQNSISDGFKDLSNVNRSVVAGAKLWLSQLMDVKTGTDLPVNSQSWSYRIVSGADLLSANAMAVLPIHLLDSNLGSVKVGNFYKNSILENLNLKGETATTLKAIAPNINETRLQVIRTGAGDIDIATGRDFQLRNQFASVYTAGVRIQTPTQIFQEADFFLPIMEPSINPPQGTDLGNAQQKYLAQWGIGGGNIRLESKGAMSRITMAKVNNSDVEILDASRQMPSNWLYRRGQVDSNTGLFAETVVASTSVKDLSSSTAWWVDYSNFFQGIGAFAGGNIDLNAGGAISNIDAHIPTTARMPGRAGGARIEPDVTRLLEYGGGDLGIKTDSDLSGGVYYIEKGVADLRVGGSVTTNSAKSPSLYYIKEQPVIEDPLVWLPTTFFAGRSQIQITAREDILLGPTTNVFLTPQGLNNKYWYKTYFQTFGENTGLEVTSLGGDITHRHNVVMDDTDTSVNILEAWFTNQNLFAIKDKGGESKASYYQPWVRLAESNLDSFSTALSLIAPSWKSTSFSGDIEISGSANVFPSQIGTIELLAEGSIFGINPVGKTTLKGLKNSIAWSSSEINMSDANSSSIPSTASPFAYQSFVNSTSADKLYTTDTKNNFLDTKLDRFFTESGDTTGYNVTIESQSSLHASSPIHKADLQPLRIHAMDGDVTGLTLFSSKFVNISASRDITDVAFYVQNASPQNISIISAGRDFIPYNENSARRSIATIFKLGDAIVDPSKPTALFSKGVRIESNFIAGDIQISGPGTLEVIAGRNIDLGTGPNFQFGTGVGITSIGKIRNPFLPANGANIVLFASLSGKNGGSALGILGSQLNFTAAGLSASEPASEANALVAYSGFFNLLRKAGDEYLESGSYETGFKAISSLYGKSKAQGDIFTRSRDIRTTSGGAITISIPGGGLTMASTIFGNPLTPPGIVTEYGGEVSVFTDRDVDIGQARIFTLRGGDMTIWSSAGDIAAGTAAKTVVTAPPTRVLIDSNSADIVTDLGGLATGGGIGVLASVEGVEEGNVSLLAPFGTVDAGDAGIRATGNIKIAAAVVLNADNISAGGSSTGVPSAPTVAAPNIGGLTSGSSSSAAASSAASQVSQQAKPQEKPVDESPSMISVEILGYGGGEGDKEEEKSASL